MKYDISLTGNEARLIFFSIKNKKSIHAENVRRKLLAIALKNGGMTNQKKQNASS